ncbi:MAG: PD40 domain-containing protein [Oscillospiraceae bacterium]|nr:PD40 domain-containing protein [Oscillospiraceae bacterium]
MNFTHISEGEYSTLLGMNGGCPESPDGSRIVYARKENITDSSKAELWICNSDLTDHRKVFDIECGNHNGPSASFIDNSLVVFRSVYNGMGVFYILNVDTGETVYGPIAAKESHCAENGRYPFSLDPKQENKNPAYPGITTAGIYSLDVKSGAITKVLDANDMLSEIKKAGYEPNEHTLSLSHVQWNPSADKVMMRIGINGFGGALLGCFDTKTKKTHFIPNKPVHQLWFDDDSYIAVYQYHDGTRWHMDKSRINRYTIDGEIIEPLGGIGNHVDRSPDKEWITGDSMYPDEDVSVFLYKRGHTEPAAVIDTHRFLDTAWKLNVHTNPSFSRDGKRIYFNRPLSSEKTSAVFADISDIVKSV